MGKLRSGIWEKKELNSDVLPVRDRSAGKQIRELSLQELTKEINEKNSWQTLQTFSLAKDAFKATPNFLSDLIFSFFVSLYVLFFVVLLRDSLQIILRPKRQ